MVQDVFTYVVLSVSETRHNNSKHRFYGVELRFKELFVLLSSVGSLLDYYRHRVLTKETEYFTMGIVVVVLYNK